jgi:hypothetical protein
MHMPRHQRGDVGTRLRCQPAGSCQLQQLVDPIVEAGDLGQRLGRLAASRRIAAVGDQFEADRDCGQRRSKLVAGVRAELAFGCLSSATR